MNIYAYRWKQFLLLSFRLRESRARVRDETYNEGLAMDRYTAQRHANVRSDKKMRWRFFSYFSFLFFFISFSQPQISRLQSCRVTASGDKELSGKRTTELSACPSRLLRSKNKD